MICVYVELMLFNCEAYISLCNLRYLFNNTNYVSEFICLISRIFNQLLLHIHINIICFYRLSSKYLTLSMRYCRQKKSAKLHYNILVWPSIYFGVFFMMSTNNSYILTFNSILYNQFWTLVIVQVIRYWKFKSLVLFWLTNSMNFMIYHLSVIISINLLP
jgi:hypothetical protein